MTETPAGIRERKSRLSRDVRLSERGEAVVPTERGTPIERIASMGRDRHERLAIMREAGQVRWSGQRPRPRAPVATGYVASWRGADPGGDLGVIVYLDASAPFWREMLGEALIVAASRALPLRCRVLAPSTYQADNPITSRTYAHL
jgi:antitoxin (DNA-binding transcriptional repressor) of toxin-antitoxin stability system